ncbi:MAG TPA: hypothetical protein VGC77_22405 [Rhodopseudomonas sp.]|uniref:hypothetical protein n=1 Tax=Rhodopseudomonas sp. TaxID=1078 RepID=UPI002ED7E75A
MDRQGRRMMPESRLRYLIEIRRASNAAASVAALTLTKATASSMEGVGKIAAPGSRFVLSATARADKNGQAGGLPVIARISRRKP